MLGSDPHYDHFTLHCSCFAWMLPPKTGPPGVGMIPCPCHFYHCFRLLIHVNRIKLSFSGDFSMLFKILFPFHFILSNPFTWISGFFSFSFLYVLDLLTNDLIFIIFFIFYFHLNYPNVLLHKIFNKYVYSDVPFWGTFNIFYHLSKKIKFQ